ncbi:MAG: diacylglycerol kinase family lipid kinase, partial [Planctomycetaceae bacterium]|nr:diacylglycerol kinase family lipid kinase [Planctomycetaceae bacterium]
MSNANLTVAIQRNPKSGSGIREAQLQRLVDGLNDQGLNPHVFTDREQFAEQLASEEFRQQLKCIVAAGGDGTVDDLINRYPGFPIAILPMGNENLLAKQFGIPQNGHEVAGIIARGKKVKIDLGQAGDHRFAVMASCGFDAEIIQRVHSHRTGHITKLSYLGPIITTLWSNRRTPLRVYTSESSKPRTCEMAIVANLSRYALNLSICPDAKENNGLFDVCLIKSTSRWDLCLLFLRGLLTSKIQSAKVERFQTDQLTIETDSPVPIQVDGDPLGQTPLEFKVLPQALELIVP